MATPRRKERGQQSPKDLLKQKIADIEQKLSMNIGALLVLLAEGTAEQVAQISKKTKTDLLKFGPDMEKLAEEMGGKLPNVVHDYLDSVDSIIHSASGWIDEAKITRCYAMTQKLHKELNL